MAAISTPTHSVSESTNGHDAHAHGNGNGNGTTDHKNYSDPDTDVAFKSNEGRVFKVESYILKAHSAYFRDLFKSGIPTEPIAIDAGTKLLKLTLDIMHMKPVPSHFVWAYRYRLLPLCDQYALQSVAERAIFSLHDTTIVEKDPWEVFCLASQRGNVALAKAALKALAEKDKGDDGQKDRPDLGALTPQFASGVTMPYLLGLFNAALGGAGASAQDVNGIGHGEGLVHTTGGSASWKIIAERFTPVMG